jgi:hypothetical protein
MWNFSFDTTAIANLQESYEALYKQGKTITAEQLSDLKKYMWITLASTLAPSNLVIRQWCLIDLFSNSPDHAKRIERMIDLLSYKKDDSGMRIWAEGGTYFSYTMDILQMWIDKFPISVTLSEPKNTPSLSLTTIYYIQQITGLLDKIRKGIAETAYQSNGAWCVAPFGDVRPGSMSDLQTGIDLQSIQQQSKVTISVISRIDSTVRGSSYILRARPIRMNLHVPKKDCTIVVTDGVPIGFTFYTGWSGKYKSTWAEICDMLSPKRLLSFFIL